MTMPDRGFGKNKVDFRGIASPASATATMPASGAGLRNRAIPPSRSASRDARARIVLGLDLTSCI